MTAKKHPRHWKFPTIHESDMGEFRDIPGTGGLCKISRDGVVVSRRRHGLTDGWWVVLSQHKSKNAKPFTRVAVLFDGDTKPKMCQLSRLMLETWVGPPPTKTSVAAHRNGVSDDDRLENLVWAEPQDVKYAQICRGTWSHGEGTGSARHTREQVEAARRIIIDYAVPVNLLAEALGEPQPRVRDWLTKTWDADKWADLQNPLEPKTDSENSKD